MRFNDKSHRLVIGKKRVVRKFLWFPLKFDGQTRWLEYANIKQEVKEIDVGGTGMAVYKKKWWSVGWADYTRIHHRGWWV